MLLTDGPLATEYEEQRSYLQASVPLAPPSTLSAAPPDWGESARRAECPAARFLERTRAKPASAVRGAKDISSRVRGNYHGSDYHGANYSVARYLVSAG